MLQENLESLESLESSESRREGSSMKNGKLVRITAIFFALMLCFTILSRAADQLSVAVVKTERPQNQMIEHVVKASGRVVQNQELAVTTLPDQRVTAIYVREGQRVAKGDLLFEVDTTLLEEKILDQQQEMEKQELLVKDAKSQKEVSAQQRANSQAQAAEQYSLSTRQAGVQLSRAKQQLDEAKKKLKKFRKSAESGKSSGSEKKDSEVEDALLQALQEKTDAYVAAQGELRALEWEIENAVYMAKQDAMAGTTAGTTSGMTAGAVQGATSGTGSGDAAEATLTMEEKTFTGSAEDVDEAGTSTDTGEGAEVTPQEVDEGDAEIVPETVCEDETFADDAIVDSISALPGDEIDLDLEIESVSSESTDEQGMGDGSTGDLGVNVSGGIDLGGNDGEETDTDAGIGNVADSDLDVSGSPVGSDLNANIKDAGDLYAGELIVDDVQDAVLPRMPTPEELTQIEQTVRANYSGQLAEAQQKLSDAQAEKEAAEAALVKYQQEQLAADNSENAQTAQQLAEAVKAAQQLYEDAALAANEAAVTSGRAVATANIADPSNSSDRMNEITYEQMELTLEKLEGLKKAKGKVCAEADGLITKINVMTGEKTLDTTALLMADLSKGYRFTADITKEQQKYIGTGDLVSLSSGDGKQKLEELPVESVAADESDENIYHVTVQLPEDSFAIGATVNLDFSRKSEAYSVTVPLSALHLDSKQQPYVLVAEEYDSIMGTEQRARRMNVTVLEQNERYAALAEGAIGSETEIIVQSDKAVDDGSRVRVET